jgi:hypothetical protein
MTELVHLVWQVIVTVANLLGFLGGYALHWLLAIAWLAWWLVAVNWRKVWMVLHAGGWAPAVLLIVAGALVWSQIAPSEWDGWGYVRIANFWWQLGAVGLLAGVTLFCGWLQGVFGWQAIEIDLDPPEVAHDGHGHH